MVWIIQVFIIKNLRIIIYSLLIKNYFPKGGEINYDDTIKKEMRDTNININGNDFTDAVTQNTDFKNALNSI